MQKTIQMPPQFDEVVDLVVSDSRAKADDFVRKQELQMERAASKMVQFDEQIDVVPSLDNPGSGEGVPSHIHAYREP